MLIVTSGAAAESASKLSREVRNDSVGVCLGAVERLPQLKGVRRTPDTIGHANFVNSVRPDQGDIAIQWEVKNIYADRRIQRVLTGSCRVAGDGHSLIDIRIVP